jgi:hypothetical protein
VLVYAVLAKVAYGVINAERIWVFRESRLWDSRDLAHCGVRICVPSPNSIATRLRGSVRRLGRRRSTGRRGGRSQNTPRIPTYLSYRPTDERSRTSVSCLLCPATSTDAFPEPLRRRGFMENDGRTRMLYYFRYWVGSGWKHSEWR